MTVRKATPDGLKSQGLVRRLEAGQALGARAVLIGRPPLWGLAAGGADGVQHVVELLASEFDNALALLGVTSARELDRSLLH